jgi:hypothetical protein
MFARVLFTVVVFALLPPSVARGEGLGVSVQGAVGSLFLDRGSSQSIAVGFVPNERWEILVSGERLHVPFEVTYFSTGFSASRGGTTKFISGEVRFVPARFNRFSPYMLVSAGGGISRPNVNEVFPERVRNDVVLWVGGGGVRVALASRLSAFVDWRFGFQTEEDSIYGFMPFRAGVAWQF